jgi:hypothetical protein
MENQKTIEIKLNDTEYNNLMIFMQRVNLKGGEVPAFVAIMNKLEGAIDGKQVLQPERV